MAIPNFGYLWKQEEMSDVDIVISAPSYSASVSSEAPWVNDSNHATLLQQFPGHSLILSYSKYFKAQASTCCRRHYLMPHDI
jgi:hypothetical protein